MVNKFAQVTPEIWMRLPFEAKQWFWDELKRQ
jgi:hypothetical protein